MYFKYRYTVCKGEGWNGCTVHTGSIKRLLCFHDYQTRQTPRLGISPEIKGGILCVSEEDVTVLNECVTNDSCKIREGKTDRTERRNINIILSVTDITSGGKYKEFKF